MLYTQGLIHPYVEPTKSALPNPDIPIYEHLKEKGVPIVFMRGFYAAMELEDINVPRDVSIIGFDNTKLGDTYKVKITSVDHPKIKLGKIAAQQLLEKMIHPQNIVKTVLEVDLIIKESVIAR